MNAAPLPRGFWCRTPFALEFEKKLVERVNSIKVGHPLDPATEVGPLISEEHYTKVTSYFDIAREDGATIAAGGEKIGPCQNISLSPD